MKFDIDLKAIAYLGNKLEEHFNKCVYDLAYIADVDFNDIKDIKLSGLAIDYLTKCEICHEIFNDVIEVSFAFTFSKNSHQTITSYGVKENGKYSFEKNIKEFENSDTNRLSPEFKKLWVETLKELDKIINKE